MARVDREARVTIKALVSRGSSNAAVARLLGVSEGAVRYHVTRMSAGALDGRGDKAFKAAPLAEAIEHWREAQTDGAINLADCTRGWWPSMATTLRKPASRSHRIGLITCLSQPTASIQPTASLTIAPKAQACRVRSISPPWM